MNAAPNITADHIDAFLRDHGDESWLVSRTLTDWGPWEPGDLEHMPRKHNPADSLFDIESFMAQYGPEVIMDMIDSGEIVLADEVSPNGIGYLVVRS